jgi:hypothetical protein
MAARWLSGRPIPLSTTPVPELLFDGVEDVLEGRAIQPVAGEDFAGEGKALGRDD